MPPIYIKKLSEALVDKEIVTTRKGFSHKLILIAACAAQKEPRVKKQKKNLHLEH